MRARSAHLAEVLEEQVPVQRGVTDLEDGRSAPEKTRHGHEAALIEVRLPGKCTVQRLPNQGRAFGLHDVPHDRHGLPGPPTLDGFGDHLP